MTKYDAKVIQKFAERLYSQARTIVFMYTFLGMVVGGVGGYFGGMSERDFQMPMAIIGTLAVGLIGFVMGQERAFALRLQAQTALCQVKIEENTRQA